MKEKPYEGPALHFSNFYGLLFGWSKTNPEIWQN
jgi:hypothetical protein